MRYVCLVCANSFRVSIPDLYPNSLWFVPSAITFSVQCDGTVGTLSVCSACSGRASPCETRAWSSSIACGSRWRMRGSMTQARAV